MRCTLLFTAFVLPPIIVYTTGLLFDASSSGHVVCGIITSYNLTAFIVYLVFDKMMNE